MNTSASGTVTLHIRVHGRVQGVGYRWWARETARNLGLVGWVRNLTDGSVEALAQGSKAQVEVFVAACHAGPPSARVTSVDTEQAEKFAGTAFDQAATASPR